MLARAALRLAVIEALCPTAAVQSGTGFPTLARHRVFDSQQILAGELDASVPFTPCLSVYTEDTRIERRGDIATSAIGNPTVDLVIVAELAERVSENGEDFTEAVIGGDASQRLILEALGAQVRATLVRHPNGSGLRKVLAAVQSIHITPYGLPEYGVRFMRDVLTFSCSIADDKYTDAAGLPEPLARVMADLPDGSYAKAKLAELAAAFLATDRDPIAGFNIHPTAGDGIPAVTPPSNSP